MAGDYIPIQVDLSRRREVVAIASALSWSRREVVGALVEFWGWASSETADGKLVDVDVDACVDALSLPKCFFESLIRVGWLEAVGDGLSIPNFDRWLSKGAKSRLSKNMRQKAWRNKRENVDAHVGADVDRKASTREEKRREENSIIERAPASPKFTHPTLIEVRAYCTERSNKVDPEKWHAYYSSNGWRVGKNPMKDWRAAVRTWERSEQFFTTSTTHEPVEVPYPEH